MFAQELCRAVRQSKPTISAKTYYGFDLYFWSPTLPKTFMPPPTTIERRLSDGQRGTITIALLVSLGAAIIVALLVVILVLRKRKNQSQDIPYGVPPTGTHKSKVPSTSMKPLLENDLGLSEKPLHVTLQFTDENARQDCDTSLNNPNKPCPTSSPHTLPLLSPPLPSSGLHQDMNPINDHPNKRPPFPPLVIPNDPQFSQTRNLNADEGSSPAQLPSTSSSPSLYSQQTAESAPTKPGFVEISLSPECPYGERRTTLLVGTLLKARAQRNPKGLVHANSQISHIERSESIKSVISTRHDNQSFSERYRSRKEKNTSCG